MSSFETHSAEMMRLATNVTQKNMQKVIEMKELFWDIYVIKLLAHVVLVGTYYYTASVYLGEDFIHLVLLSYFFLWDF